MDFIQAENKLRSDLNQKMREKKRNRFEKEQKVLFSFCHRSDYYTGIFYVYNVFFWMYEFVLFHVFSHPCTSSGFFCV